MANPPEGFGPIFRSSPALDALGGFCSRGSGAALEIGLLVGPSHLNSRGTLHGGVMALLADVGLGYLLAFGTEPPRRLLTAGLNVDYLSPAREGDWVQVVLDDVQTIDRRVLAAGRLVADGRVVAQLQGRFAGA